MQHEYEKVQKASILGRLKFLVKDSMVYGLFSSLSKFMHVFLLPVATRYISKADYGVYDTLLIIFNVVVVLIIAGTDNSVARFFYEDKDSTKQKELISQTLIFELTMSLFWGFVLWLASGIVLKFYFDSTAYMTELTILIFILPFVSIVRFSQNVLKWVFKRNQFLIVSSGSIVTTILLSIIAITSISPEIKFLFYSQLISMAVFSVVGLYFCREYLIIPRSFNTIIPQLKFGLPLTVNQILTTVVPAIDRYFITAYLDLTLLGVYAVGNKISQMSQVAINGFQIAWGPLAYSIMNEEDSKETYNKIFDYYVIFISIFILVFTLFTPIFIKILATSEYLSAAFIILILLISKLINSLSGVTAIGIGLSKKTYYNLIASGIQILSTVLFIYLLVKQWGINGVALGVLGGNILYMIVVSYFSQKVSNVSFKFRNQVIVLLIAIGISVLVLMYNSFVLSGLITVAGITAVLTYAAYFIIDSADKQVILQKLKSIKIF